MKLWKIKMFKGFMYRRMITLLALLPLVAVVQVSCEEKKTENVLSQDEMVKILSEIYVAEDKVSRLSIPPDSGQQIFQLMLKRIHEQTSIPDSTFKRSMEYYSQHPDKMEKIYAALVDSLNLKEQRTPD
jgi:hypothetical protein